MRGMGMDMDMDMEKRMETEWKARETRDVDG
jgi:hypothetical protein